MRYPGFIFILAAHLFLAVGCSAQNTAEIDRILSETADRFAPDSRVALFDINYQKSGKDLLLTGETTLPDAKKTLLDSLSGFDLTVTDRVTVLPAAELHGNTFGVIKNSVSNLRTEPSHPAQLATQATLGMPLKVLKKQSNWYLVQTPDDYLSWIDSGGLKLMDEEEYENWRSAAKLIYLNTHGYAFAQPSASASKVSDLVSGSILKLNGTEGDFYSVSYPDGRQGFVRRNDAQPFDEWKKAVTLSEKNLVTTARTMMGIPYLWGGTSTKGVDCSGYTKTIYFMNGWIIPRDASQQVHAGVLVDTSDSFDNLRPGDLLFFGSPANSTRSRRVVHVGMWIGNNEFIHSPERPGHVTISSVDPEAPNYDEFNLNRFLEARRYLNNKKGNIIDVEQMFSLKP